MPGVILEAVIGNTDIAGLADSSAITDETGKSVFGMNTELPGLTDITFRVEGTSLAKILSLDITVDENRPLRPTAQIGTTVYTADSPKENYITVDKGEQLIIQRMIPALARTVRAVKYIPVRLLLQKTRNIV